MRVTPHSPGGGGSGDDVWCGCSVFVDDDGDTVCTGGCVVVVVIDED